MIFFKDCLLLILIYTESRADDEALCYQWFAFIHTYIFWPLKFFLQMPTRLKKNPQALFECQWSTVVRVFLTRWKWGLATETQNAQGRPRNPHTQCRLGIRMNLAMANQVLGDLELLDSIFLPGFLYYLLNT